MVYVILHLVHADIMITIENHNLVHARRRQEFFSFYHLNKDFLHDDKFCDTYNYHLVSRSFFSNVQSSGPNLPRHLTKELHLAPWTFHVDIFYVIKLYTRMRETLVYKKEIKEVNKMLTEK